MDIQEIIDSNFRGNIYVVQDGKVIIENESGFADLANEIPIRWKQNLQAHQQEKSLSQ